MAALDQSQLEQLVQKLNDDNKALVREVRSGLENPADQHRIDLLNREPGDVGDESVADALADFNVARLDRQIQQMRDIDAAFQRIKDGAYGVCIDCGSDIGFKRLQAYPTAKRCIACQEKHEREYAHENQPKM